MQEVAVVGLDLAKNVFQVHGLATDGGVVFRRQLRRNQVRSFFQVSVPLEPRVRRPRAPDLGASSKEATRRGG